MKKQTTDARVGFPPTPTERMTKREIISVYQNMASLVSRAALSSSLGQTFGGLRDLYEVLGWKKNLVFQDYLDMYDRNGIAARVVDALADESWRKPPIMKDGLIMGDAENEKQHTEFIKAWNNLAEELDLWAIMNELDTALGISRYAIILLGVVGKDSGKYDQPLAGTKKIAYLQVYDEGQAPIATWDRGVNSPRYGLPTSYTVSLEDGGRAITVHHTRVIHCKEGRGRSRVYGTPRLQKPYNYLSDLEKVVGSSSEAFWLMIRKGLILSAQEGTNMPTVGTPEYVAMQDEITEWEHQLRRVMRLKGVDVTDMGSDAVDGRSQHDLLITDIAGTVGMPQRVLVGSERGELASTQDDANWASVVSSRQTQTCMRWVKDFAKTLISLGVLPKPTSKMSIEFPELFQLTTLEKSTLAESDAKGINAITGNVPDGYIDIEDFLKKNYKYKVVRNQDAIDQANAEEAIPPEVAPGGGDLGGGLEGEQETQLITV